MADDAPPGEDDDKPASDEENLAMRERIIFGRKKFFKETEEKVKNEEKHCFLLIDFKINKCKSTFQVQGRWKYEDQIKRPYFHMKPLERGQLKNWNDYLDHEIKAQEKNDVKDDELISVLFERCLIACALYEEFWLKYAKWLKEKKDASDEDKEARIEQIR